MAVIDRWVIQHAVSEITVKRGQNHRVNFFINIGEQTLQDESLLILICDCLSDFQARGNWLTFQVSEEHARRHSAAFLRLNEGLKRVKCRIAVNGFGLDPNPETTLSSLRMDFVKFAPELAQGLVESEVKQRRLVELTKMARDQGVRSIVTGVEDARTLTVLWTAGIDYVQGNFLQPPSATIDI
jgi:EAL domain-containing protein (putative c-di-GMP-specific phosphodiesterase class I)